MPLLLRLVAVFICSAENIGTFAGSLIYHNQAHGWAPMGVGKLGSRLLLISYVMVSAINRPQPLPVEARSATMASSVTARWSNDDGNSFLMREAADSQT